MLKGPSQGYFVTRSRFFRAGLVTGIACLLGLSLVPLTVGVALASTPSPNPAPRHTIAGPAGLPAPVFNPQTAAAGTWSTSFTPLPIINCSTVIQNPHSSGHNPGNVVVQITTTCAGGFMTSIADRVELYQQNVGWISDSGTIVCDGVPGCMAAAPQTCQNGWYIGWGQWYLVPPPGYSPPSASGSGYGNWAYVYCS